MDRISDFLTIIRNANNAHKETCSAPYSKINRHIAEIMKNEGFVREIIEGKDLKGRKTSVIKMKYVGDKSVEKPLNVYDECYASKINTFWQKESRPIKRFCING